MKRIHQFAAMFVLVSSTVNLIGCGGPTKGKDQLPTLKIRGEVQVDGTATGPGTLNLKSSDKKLPLVVGNVDDSGKFSLTTYQKDDGAPKGEYTATLVASLTDPTKAIPEVQPLKVEITEANSSLVLEFKGTGKQVVNPIMVPPKNIAPPK